MSRFRFLVAAIVVVLVAAQPAGAATVVLSPPTNASVLDPFRLPDGPYGAGNRGIEYDTGHGDAVRAAADGVVAFAAQVGGNLFVSLDHPGGLRTTYGFVAHMRVDSGASVTRGEVVATTDGPFHFTVRLRGRYVDPASLFGVARTSVRLVPHRFRFDSSRYTSRRPTRASDDPTSGSTKSMGSCITRSPRRPARTRNREEESPWQSSQ